MLEKWKDLDCYLTSFLMHFEYFSNETQSFEFVVGQRNCLISVESNRAERAAINIQLCFVDMRDLTNSSIELINFSTFSFSSGFSRDHCNSRTVSQQR